MAAKWELQVLKALGLSSVMLMWRILDRMKVQATRIVKVRAHDVKSSKEYFNKLTGTGVPEQESLWQVCSTVIMAG